MMDSLDEFDPSLPVDFENRYSHLQALQSIHPFLLKADGGASKPSYLELHDGTVPMVTKLNTGRMSPIRARTMKEYDQQLGELKMENFDLKLRIFHMQQQKQFTDGNDVYNTNVELNVLVEKLKKDVNEKSDLLQKASSAIRSLSGPQEQEMNKLKDDHSREITQLKLRLESQINKQNEDLQNKEYEIKDLGEKMEDLKAQVGQLEEERGQVQGRVDTQAQEVDQKVALINDLRDTVKSKEAMLANQKAECVSLSNALKDARVQLQCSSKDNKNDTAELNKKLADLEKNITSKDMTLKKKDDMIGRLEDFLRDKEQQITASKDKIKESDEKIEKMKKEQSAHLKMIQGLASARIKKEHEIKVKGDEFTELTKVRDNLQRLQEMSLKEVEKCHSEIFDRNESIKSLKKHAQSCDNKLKTMEETLTQERQRISDMEKQHSQTQILLDDCHRQSNNKEKLLQQLTSSLKDKDQQLQQYIELLKPDPNQRSKDELLKQLQERLKQTEATAEKHLIDRFASEKEKDAENHKLRESVREIERNVTKGNNLLETAQDTIHTLEAENKEMVAEIKQLSAAVRVGDKALEEEKETKLNLIEEKDGIIDGLKTALESRNRALEESMCKSLENDTAKLSQLQEGLAIKDQMLEEIVKERNRAEELARRTHKEMSVRVQNRDKDYSALQAKYHTDVQAYEKNLQNLHNTHSKLERQLQDLQHQSEETEKRLGNVIAKHQTDIADKDTTIKELVESGQEKEKLFDTLQRELLKTKSDHSFNTHTIEELQEKLTQSQATTENLQKSNTDLQKIIDELQTTNTELEKANTDVENIIRDLRNTIGSNKQLLADGKKSEDEISRNLTEVQSLLGLTSGQGDATDIHTLIRDIQQELNRRRNHGLSDLPRNNNNTDTFRTIYNGSSDAFRQEASDTFKQDGGEAFRGDVHDGTDSIRHETYRVYGGHSCREQPIYINLTQTSTGARDPLNNELLKSMQSLHRRLDIQHCTNVASNTDTLHIDDEPVFDEPLTTHDLQHNLDPDFSTFLPSSIAMPTKAHSLPTKVPKPMSTPDLAMSSQTVTSKSHGNTQRLGKTVGNVVLVDDDERLENIAEMGDSRLAGNSVQRNVGVKSQRPSQIPQFRRDPRKPVSPTEKTNVTDVNLGDLDSADFSKPEVMKYLLHGAKAQIDGLERKLLSTEATVRSQSKKIRFYRSLAAEGQTNLRRTRSESCLAVIDGNNGVDVSPRSSVDDDNGGIRQNNGVDMGLYRDYGSTDVIAELKDQINVLRSQLKQVCQISNVKNDVKNDVNDEAQNKRTADDLKIRFAQLQSENEKLRSQINALESSLRSSEDLEYRLLEIQSENDGLRSDIGELQSMVKKGDDLRVECVKLKTENTSLKSHIDENDAYSRVTADLKSRLIELQAENEQLRLHINESESKSLLSDDFKSRFIEIQKENEKLRSLVRENESKSRISANLESQLIELQAENDRLKSHIDETDSKSRVYSDLQSRLLELESDNNRLKSQIDEVDSNPQNVDDAEIRRLKHQLSHSQMQVLSLSVQIEDVMACLERRYDDVKRNDAERLRSALDHVSEMQQIIKNLSHSLEVPDPNADGGTTTSKIEPSLELMLKYQKAQQEIKHLRNKLKTQTLKPEQRSKTQKPTEMERLRVDLENSRIINESLREEVLVMENVSAGDHGTVLQEYLEEMRATRKRLEESLKKADRLNALMEQQLLAGKGVANKSDSHHTSNMSSLPEVARLSTSCSRCSGLPVDSIIDLALTTRSQTDGYSNLLSSMEGQPMRTSPKTERILSLAHGLAMSWPGAGEGNLRPDNLSTLYHSLPPEGAHISRNYSNHDTLYDSLGLSSIHADTSRVKGNKPKSKNRLVAITELNDYELMKKENDLCRVSLSGLQARIKDRLTTLRQQTPLQLLWNMEYSTMKELSMTADNLRVSLSEETKLLTQYSIIPLPNEDANYNQLAKQNAQMKDDMRQLIHKYESLKEYATTAQQQLKDVNRRKQLSEDAVYKALVKTDKVLRQANANFRQHYDICGQQPPYSLHHKTT